MSANANSGYHMTGVGGGLWAIALHVGSALATVECSESLHLLVSNGQAPGSVFMEFCNCLTQWEGTWVSICGDRALFGSHRCRGYIYLRWSVLRL